MKLLSIIIPVYNVEKYLYKCLSSIVSQCDDRVQIILVDDGSTDNSIKSVENIIKAYKNIQVHSKSNGGLSSARNFGINKAVGKYIYFVDSDDYIADNSLNKILDKLAASNEDYFAFNYTTTEQVENFGLNISSSGSFNAVDISEYLKHHQCPITNVWRVMVLRDLIVKNNILFREGILCEDIEWLTRLLLKINTVYVSDIMLYVYNNQRAGSIMNVLSAKRVADTANNIDISMSMVDQLNDNQHRQAFLKLLFVEWCANLSYYALLTKEDRHSININDCFKKINELFIIRLYNSINKVISLYGSAKLLYYFRVSRKWIKKNIKR